jgi:hypothetical protein
MPVTSMNFFSYKLYYAIHRPRDIRFWVFSGNKRSSRGTDKVRRLCKEWRARINDFINSLQKISRSNTAPFFQTFIDKHSEETRDLPM